MGKSSDKPSYATLHIMNRSVEQIIDDISRSSIGEATRKQYERCQKRFVRWLKTKKPILVKENDEVDLKQLQPRVFSEFILDSCSTSGRLKGISTLSMYRSALYNMYRDQNILMPTSMRAFISKFYKGLKRMEAKEKQNGLRRLQEGKEPLSFQLYSWLGKRLISSQQVLGTFAHLFLLLQWNLMSQL